MRELSVDDAILRVLAARQHSLLHALAGRGHAAIDPIPLTDAGLRRWREGALPTELEDARAHPEWSGLTARPADMSGARQSAILAVAKTFD